MSQRRILIGSAGAVAVLLTAVSLAWACVPQGSLEVTPSQGAAGSTVKVSGDFDGTAVEICWGSIKGPLLKTVQLAPGSTKFSGVDVQIPADAAPGPHLLAAAITGEHAAHSAKAVPFDVTSGSGGGGGGSGGARCGATSGGGEPGGGGTGGGGTTEPPPTPAPTPEAPQPTPPTPTAPAPAAPRPAGGTQQPAARTSPNSNASKRAKAVARCKKRYSARSAKTRGQKRRVAKKRKACIKKANRSHASSAALQASLSALIPW